MPAGDHRLVRLLVMVPIGGRVVRTTGLVGRWSVTAMIDQASGTLDSKEIGRGAAVDSLPALPPVMIPICRIVEIATVY